MLRPLITGLLATLLGSCGAKTALEVEPCQADGGVRTCTTVCGEGEQQCVDGRWASCLVPPGRVPCTNACGEGTQACEDGRLGECEVPVAERPCSTECGEGIQICADGAWGPCSADAPLPPVLDVWVRDFRSAHPDFEGPIGDDRGIVLSRLGRDDKPVYAGDTPTTSGAERFDQWYRDTAGVNRGIAVELPLEAIDEDASLFVFEDREFFPIDGLLFGNEGREHNFHFTLEATTEFLYQGGEIFRFRGDDDVFVFINRRLAIDLGGVHSTEEATVSLDERASELGLELGRRYPIHLFFAERHTDQSTFTVETSIADTLRCVE